MTETATQTNMANDAARELREQVLEGIRKGQGAIVGAVQVWADTVQRFAHDLPALPKIPANQVKAEELVAEAYDFAAQALANQREFAENLLKAAEPVLAHQR